VLKISCATVDVSPVTPQVLSGFAKYKRPVDKIGLKLEANILLISCETSCHLLVSVDWLYGTQGLYRSLLEWLTDHALQKDLGVAIFASHTHFAPQTDIGKNFNRSVDAVYLQDVTSRIVSACETLFRNDQGPFAIVHHRPLIFDEVVYRRKHCSHFSLGRYKMNPPGIRLAPDETVDIDKRIRLIGLHSLETDELLAIIWSFSCHPVNYPVPDELSSEYPGYVRNRIREVLNKPALPVCFFQGFSGDVRPWPTTSRHKKHSMLFRILFGPKFPGVSCGEWFGWAKRLADTVTGMLLRSDKLAREIPSRMELTTDSIPLERFLENASSGSVSIIKILLGNLHFLGIGMEATQGLRKWIVGQCPETEDWWFTGYVNEVHGYLPSPQQITEGGYEADGHLPEFDSGSRFRRGLTGYSALLEIVRKSIIPSSRES